jgi:tetratricopeptide (TPR) repeat protein
VAQAGTASAICILAFAGGLYHSPLKQVGLLMGEEPAAAEPERYRAFISYSHGDAKFAHWLHRKLESWRLPDKSRLTPVFIDRAELAAGSDLSAQVREALKQSAALVVVCSPNARASRWVGQEIALFRALHPARPVLAALIDGAPDAAFPDPLLGTGDSPLEPLAADFRKGHDGQRLGLLKLAAGLTRLPLDRLVQRDAATRQRRVMAITAAALALVLVLSTALVIALRARAEAERQRAEAEGLVEFMLTDLRDKLEGVGRLEIMGAVNERALQHYSRQPDLSELSLASLDRRARLIEAMGQDNEQRGEIDLAVAKYAEVHRITADLLARDPQNPELIFAHARSENRLALTATTRGLSSAAWPHFKSAKALLDRLPQNQIRPQWTALRSLVVGNLCAMTLSQTGDASSALDNCREAVALAQQAIKQSPDNRSFQYDLVFHYLWLGDAAQAAGKDEEARTARAAGLENSQRLIELDQHNMVWIEQNIEVCLHLAKRAASDGRKADASQLSKRALTSAETLARHDPANQYWAQLLSKARAFNHGRSK